MVGQALVAATGPIQRQKPSLPGRVPHVRLGRTWAERSVSSDVFTEQGEHRKGLRPISPPMYARRRTWGTRPEVGVSAALSSLVAATKGRSSTTNQHPQQKP